MKKKVISYLFVLFLIFFSGGLYIYQSITRVIQKLDNIVELHQVEILRSQLLLDLKKVQVDLLHKDTPRARDTDTIVNHMTSTEATVLNCFSCHHDEVITKRLISLKNEVELYKNAISRIYTIRANTNRLRDEQVNTFRIGEHLIQSLNNMVSITSTKLKTRTAVARQDIAHSKNLLTVFLLLGPLVAIIIALVFTRSITKPVGILTNATRKLKAGQLDHRIEGLRDDFGELADSFNEMAVSLKEKMQRIREEQKRYRLLFESAGDAIFILDIEGDKAGAIVSANQAAADMHGYTINELLRMNIGDLDTVEAAAGIPARIGRMLKGEWINDELSHRRKDGAVFPVEISAGLLEYEGHKYILAFDRDITERKTMENALRDSEERFRTLVEQAADAFFLHDKAGRLLDVNQYACDMLGYSRQELLGLSFAEIETAQNRERLEQILAELPPNRPVTVQRWQWRKDGTALPVEARISRVQWGDRKLFLSLVRDISERKRLEEGMQRAEQMVMCGTIAAGLAHEIKNPLTGIKVAIELFKDELPLQEDDKEVLEKVIDEINRIDTLVKGLLNFARPPKPQYSFVDINQVIERAVTTAYYSIKKSSRLNQINIVSDLGRDLPSLRADLAQLQQILLNLLLNAVDAIQDTGTVTVCTRYNQAADCLEIEVADTGKGFDQKSIDKLFQPFFTTKAKGTGLGLAISKRLVEQQQGTLTATNNPAGGAVFLISLPAHLEIEVQET